MSVDLPPTLAPIGLEELIARAALQTRVDRKYVLSVDDAGRLAASLPAGTHVLEAEGRRAFDYASLYFDTPARDAYLAAARQRRRRFKVRTRCYRATGACYLEVKTRQGRFTVKERIPHGIAEDIKDEATAFVADRLVAAGIGGIDVRALEPVLATAYTRTTLFLPADRSRVTLDVGCAFSTAVGGRPGRTIRLPGIAIVETKTAGLPSPVDRLLWSLGVRPTAISKYGTGLAAIDPELPHARWHRLLRTAFATGPQPGDARPSDPTRALEAIA